MPDKVLSEFGWNAEEVIITPLQQGLINNTWKIAGNERTYILQKINHSVFKDPYAIDYNIKLVADHLQQFSPQYKFIRPLPGIDNKTIMHVPGDGYYRVFPFIEGSVTKEVVQSPAQAYEAARQFGMFTRQLAGIDLKKLKVTIPDFHNLSLRFKQFTDSQNNGKPERIKKAAELIKELNDQVFINEEYEKIQGNPQFKLRAMHHDTKISNVLFDEKGNGLCVIDLDTVMPGYFFSDFGDMIRTYISPVSEEETDLSKIEIRIDFYKAVVRGYLQEMKDELTDAEKAHLFCSGVLMVYMQAIRFLTDYLNADVYYKPRYEEHNLNRARNQARLLERFFASRDELENIIQSEIKV